MKSSILCVVLMSTSCAKKTPGAQPHDMGSTSHEAEAEQHAQLAAQEQAQYDPNATTSEQHCGGQDPHGAQRVCWTTFTNPTAEHLAEAEEHRKMAADHRAASTALVAAEETACVGIAEDDRAMSPFDHVEDIVSVKPLQQGGGKTPAETVGVVVTLRAVPGLTAEWLQRIVDCHIARASALGHVVPEMPNCPLVPNGVTATVSSTGDGFAVEIRSTNRATAAEVLARAERLTAPTAGATAPSK
jgi:hypothetical protein